MSWKRRKQEKGKLKFASLYYVGSSIRDPRSTNFRIRINIPDPQHCTVYHRRSNKKSKQKSTGISGYRKTLIVIALEHSIKYTRNGKC
jgi:hypothetical protein